MGFLSRHGKKGVKPAEAVGFAAAWRTTTFLLVFVGFFALAATGEIHPLVGALFVASWALGIVSGRNPSWWRPWMAYPLTGLPLVVILIVILMGRFESLLYLLMFLGLYKCNTLRDPGDHMQALLMAFFMLLACTIITHSASYIGFILVFLVLTTLELSFMTIARETERSGASAARIRSAAAHPHARVLGGRLLFDAIAYGFFMLLLGYVLFLVMPHYSLDTRFSNPFNSAARQDTTEALTGYQDDLTLHNLNRISLDEKRVMDVSVSWWPENPALPTPPALWLRGTVLNTYDGRRWSLARQVGSEWMSNNWYEINFAQPSGILLEQRIRQDLNQVERLFGVPQPVSFGELPRGYATQMNYLTWTLKLNRYPDSTRRGKHDIDYLVYSQAQPQPFYLLEKLSRRGLKAPADEGKWLTDEQFSTLVGQFDPRNPPRLSNEEIRINTQLPPDPVSALVMDLAQRHMTASADPDKILQLLAWMRTEFEYTLEPGTGGDPHPLETFLTKTRRGHCEYFASAFVLMLRAQRIPSRVVLGFHTNELYPNRNVFIVRQSCAHAWAEVWLNGYGWMTIDPTPPSYRGRSSLLLEKQGGLRWTGAMLRQAWQRYVLDYSRAEQNELMRKIASSAIVRSLAGIWRPISEKIMARIPAFRTGRSVKGILGAALWLAVPALIVLAVAGAAFILMRRFWRRKRLARIYRSPVEFINLWLAALQNKGWKRRPDQTIAEFARQVEAQTQWPLAPIVDLYQRCRFAGEELTAREEAAAREIIHRIQHAQTPEKP
ncbi:MAG: DUF3488 and transglutaminase-like domain-containing protein [Candidatus Sumerlaeia bacterium]